VKPRISVKKACHYLIGQFRGLLSDEVLVTN
jgi:hypothetical protein